MKRIGAYLLSLSLLGMAVSSQASTFLQWGIGMAHPSTAPASDVKYLEAGAAKNLGRFQGTLSVGGWTDRTFYESKGFVTSNSGYLSAMLGVEPRSGHMYLGYRAGPMLISHKDALLGSHFQVGQQLSIGMHDARGVKVGLALRHFSNGGMTKINQGRNFLGIEVGF